MPRRIVAALILASLSYATCGRAATFLYYHGQRGPFGAVLPPRWYDETTVLFSGAYIPGFLGINVHVTNRANPGDSWDLIWDPQPGVTFAAGTYETPSAFRISAPSECAGQPARVVVHEVATGTLDLRQLSLDYELACRGTVPSTIRGALRYHAGDATCADAPEGTPCDDRDACTPSSACVAGTCAPAAGRPACVPESPCVASALCVPLDGACVAVEPGPDDVACDDASVCTVGDRCAQGTCVGDAITCDDDSPCTADACEATTGCTFTPVAGQCWWVAGRAVARVRASGTIRGIRVHCWGACTSTSLGLLLIDGDQYRLPSEPTRCLDGQTLDLVDETGRLLPARRGRLVFAPDNLPAVAADLRACTGAELARQRRRMAVESDGREATLREVLVTRVREELPAKITIATRYRGVRDGPSPLAPPPPRSLPHCSDLRLRCRAE